MLFAVRTVEAKYKSPARYADLIDIITELKEITQEMQKKGNINIGLTSYKQGYREQYEPGKYRTVLISPPQE